MINRKELIQKYIKFFKSKEHAEVPNAPLVPENDPTVLFTTAGMHPLVPYLLGQPHPQGKRLCNVQKCIRTGDIEEVGDTTHHTFFEMMGNWSVGDYFKEEAIKWSFEFLKKELEIPIERLAVTVFKGDKDAPKDKESAEIWESLGIPKQRIAFLEKKDNWWGPAGQTGPCGPDTEMFYWKDNSKPAPEEFNPEDETWVEIWNDVLMQYIKDKRLILVDGMHCLYDKDFKTNKELLKFINNLNAHTILTVAGFREKGLNSIRESDPSKDTNWQAFSLEEEKIKKDNPEFFKRLLKQFNLNPKEVLYFDHKKESVEAAEKVGILSKHYTNPNSIKDFINNNLLDFFPAKQKNVDTGMGVERTSAILNGLEDNYLGDSFYPIIQKIEKISKREYDSKENKKSMRIIADHIKASVFIIADGVVPGNCEQGYVLRRLIRRAVRYGKSLNIQNNFTKDLGKIVINIYDDYKHLQKNKDIILEELDKEETQFREKIASGLKIISKLFEKKQPINNEKFAKLIGDPNKQLLIGRIFEMKKNKKDYSIKDPKISKEEIDKATINGDESFLLFQSYGFPIEMVDELAMEKGFLVDHNGFREEFQKHQELSRTASAGVFKAGLADSGEATTRLHTATHMLLRALQIVLKDDSIIQKGSNINPERLRFDFSFPRKVTKEELTAVEDLVNAEIQKSCEVIREEMSLDEAKKKVINATFEDKYGEKVSVYSIGDFSTEICSGPHAKNTCELGHFKIKKETSSSAGVRRIKAVLE